MHEKEKRFMLVMRVKQVNPNPTHLKAGQESLTRNRHVYYAGRVVRVGLAFANSAFDQTTLIH